MIEIKRTDSKDPDFQSLVKLLDKDLAIRDGNDHAFYDQYNKIEGIKNVIVYYNNGNAIGCGAFKKYNKNEAEIKRMYVLPEDRGKGIAVKILTELEIWAAEENFSGCILETGKAQPEAIRLYLKSGYTIIPNYGQYENVENSVCMMKAISKKV